MKESLQARISGWLEDPNPILLKELRATFRTPLFARFLYISVGLVSLLVLGVGAIAASDETPPATVGQIVFQLFFSSTLFVICLFAPGYAATTITSEREQRTWESLQLSGMSASRVVHGKFLAAYASIALVIVSLAPVSGIGFLFGGVAPVQVAVGLLSMLVALAPAIAFGIAVSARLPSTRLAIVLATFIYMPTALMGTIMMSGFGQLAHSEWHLAMEGPFFYADAFATRADEWDTWAILLGGTLYGIGMPVWFLLASAIAGVRPAAENRAAPLKRWAWVMSVSTTAVIGVALLAADSARSEGKLGLLALSAIGALMGFYALLFANEPPLPPRPWERALRDAPAWRRALGAFGPGAAGTLRFSAVLIVATGALSWVTVVSVRHLSHPRWSHHVEYDLASLAIVVGLAVISLFGAAFGTWMRILLRNGLAARAITSALIAGLAIAPFLFALLIDINSTRHLSEEAPLLAHFSTVYPLILAAQLNDMSVNHALGNFVRIAVPSVTYGLLGLACWATVEARVRAARAFVEKKRARLDASVAPSSVALNAAPEPSTRAALPTTGPEEE